MSDAPTISPAAPKPAHVLESLVYDFDYHADEQLVEKGHDRIIELLKDAPPVFWTPRNGGHWVVQSHQAVFDAQRDTELFSSEPFPYAQLAQMNASLPEGTPKLLVPLPITVDPPVHTKLRAPLQKPFSPKEMAKLKDAIRALAGELIDAVKPNGACAFMAAIGEPMPVQVFLKMFGLPVARQREYRDLVHEHMRATSTDQAENQRRSWKVAEIMHDTLIERRDNPRDDLISMLWESEFDGIPATLYDVQNYCVLLFIAGLDTVMNGMGHGILHLAKNPELQDRLRANPELIPEATEEMLRRYTFTVPVRFIGKDGEFHGANLKKGEHAMMFLPGADLDSQKFPDAEKFDLDRENKAHIAFGAGPHRCLGSHLARVELNILYEEVLARLPTFSLDATKKLTFHGGNVVGPDEVHIVW